MDADRSLDHLFPAFRDRVLICLTYLNAYLKKHHPGLSAEMIEGYRSTERQQELYAQGRTTPGKIVTEKNGTTNPSNHQSALAADIGIYENGRYIEEPDQDVWDQLQHAAHVNDLTSGGDWTGFRDWPHVEWPVSDSETYAIAKAWKATKGLK